MVIWLEGKNLDDLVKIPLSLNEGRWDLKRNETDSVYQIEGQLFHCSPHTAFLDVARFKYLAGGGESECEFKDPSGNQQKVRYWLVELSTEIPEEFLDVFFYHQVTEFLHKAKKIPYQEAHGLASVADQAYRQKYLSAEQQESLMKKEQQLSPRPYHLWMC